MTSTNNESGIDLSGDGGMTWDDATWILTSSFIIFTMQSGFGLLEAGNVSSRNEVNIMVKNVVDVVFGGLTYWMFGFGLSYGQDKGTNPFCGIGHFFVDVNSDEMGIVYSTFVFQLSFATTATTIVSGAMAERTKLVSYIIFSLFNTVVYCIPAHWAWDSKGFIAQMGGIDFAGSGVVHMVGGVSGLVATIMLKPRIGRFDGDDVSKPPMANPTNAVVGLFMLWWGWLAFNCGSTFGISQGKWKLAAKAAVTTLLSSMSGGIVGTTLTFFVHKGKFDVGYIVNSILGALVSVTASCPLIFPWEAIVIGCIGALVTLGFDALLDKLKIDDPVSAVAVHGAAGVWGMLAVGLFASQDRVEDLTGGRNGLFHGGGFYLLGVQLLAVVCELAWSASLTFLLLYPLQVTLGLRLSPEDEMLGCDYVEHDIRRENFGSSLTFTSHSQFTMRPTAKPTLNHFVQSLHSSLDESEEGDDRERGSALSLISGPKHNGHSKPFENGGSQQRHNLGGKNSDVPMPSYLNQVYPD